MSLESVCHSDNTDRPIILLSRKELLKRYADAAAQAKLLAGLLRLATRVGEARSKPVAVPVRLRQPRSEVRA